MSIRSGYSNTIVTFGIMLENKAMDLACHRPMNGFDDFHPDWDEDRYEAARWLYDQWCSIFPGVVNCEHGMSLQNCYGPAHYASDYELNQGW